MSVKVSAVVVVVVALPFIVPVGILRLQQCHLAFQCILLKGRLGPALVSTGFQGFGGSPTVGIDSPHFGSAGRACIAMKDPFSVLLLGSKKKAMEIAQTADLNVRNEHGQTLMFAAAGRPSMKGSAEVLCQMLQERGLNVDALDVYQQTPLFAVAREGNETCADYLIAHGANPNHADLRGETPLCVAFRNSQMELVMRFLDEPIFYIFLQQYFWAFFGNCFLYFACYQARKEASKETRKHASKQAISKEGNKPAKPGTKYWWWW